MPHGNSPPSNVPDLVPDPSDSEDDSDYNPLPTPGIHSSSAQPDPRAVNFWQANLTNYVPPKRAEEGSFDFVVYVPPWMDPQWVDEGPDRQRSDWPVTNGLIDLLRPAMLARDQLMNPTPYAQRFGAYPGRSDGRSRTSPTRCESRQLFGDLMLDGDVSTGKELFSRMDRNAQSQGLSIEDYIDAEKPHLQSMGQREQAYMQAYQELVIDEYWQGILFGNHTMDELMANNHFTMEHAASDLDGPLYPLLERHRWLDTRWDGTEASRPRLLYDIDGERAEYDPHKNDKVWKALQPALQLASRLLQSTDPFLLALGDITSRSFVDPRLDGRSAADKRTFPKIRFDRYLDSHNARWPQSAQRMRKDFSPQALRATWQVLVDKLQFKVYSGHYSIIDGSFEPNAVVGEAAIPAMLSPHTPMYINIAVELMWPLLSVKFSESEKMMASFIIATTLVHEFTHAWSAAHFKMLANPQAFGMTEAEEVKACTDLLNDLCPNRRVNEEAHFEDDPVAEIGHAYETHVLGGGTWTLGTAYQFSAGPKLLADFPCVVAHMKFPDGHLNGPPNLPDPKTRYEAFFCWRRIDQIQDYFRKEFWQTVVPKYGMVAMRNAPVKPSMVSFPVENGLRWNEWFLGSGFATQIDRKWISAYINELNSRGKGVLATYIRSVVMESCRFEFMTQRFLRDMQTWKYTERQYLTPMRSLCLMIHEFRAAVFLSDETRSQAEIGAGVKREFDAWNAAYMGTINKGIVGDLQTCRCWDGTLETFSNGVRVGHEDYDKRIVQQLMEVASFLDVELRNHENMICELYDLAPEFWPLYLLGVPDHHRFWISRVGRILDGLRFIVNNLDPVANGLFMWRDRWNGRIRFYIQSFWNVYQIITKDSGSVASNWRDALVTIPLLRKSRRKPRERWFFLAKKEMLDLAGRDLEKMKEFKTRFGYSLNLGYKIVLPAERFNEQDEQELAQLWAGLLDDGVEKKKSGNELNAIFHTEGVKSLTTRLQQEKQQEEASNVDRAAARARANAAAAAEKKGQSALKKPHLKWPNTLQELAAAGASGPSNNPQLTRPGIENHPHPLSGLTDPSLAEPLRCRLEEVKFGQASLRGTSTPESGTVNTSVFSSYAGTPNHFSISPSPAGTPPVWKAQGPEELAANIHEPFGNQPASAAPTTGGLMPHAYAIRTTVTKDLQNVVTSRISPTLPPALLQQPPRQGPSHRSRPSQGKGKLGDVERTWEQQEWPAPVPAPDEDEEMEEAGQALLVRAIVDWESSEDEDDKSAMEATRLLRESSDSTAVESEDSSEVETDVGSGAESGSETGLKRKLSVVEDNDEGTGTRWGFFNLSWFRGMKRRRAA